MKKKLTRAEKRKSLEDFKICCELFKIINHFFPQLVSLLSSVEDHRKKNYTTYSSKVILYIRIIAGIFFRFKYASTY